MVAENRQNNVAQIRQFNLARYTINVIQEIMIAIHKNYRRI